LERRIKIEHCKVEILPPLLVGLTCHMASQTKGTTFATKAFFHLSSFVTFRTLTPPPHPPKLGHKKRTLEGDKLEKSTNWCG